MRIFSWLLIISTVLLISCNTDNNAYLELKNSQYFWGDTLQVSNLKELDHITYDGVAADYLILDSTQFPLGQHSVLVEAQHKNQNLSKTFNFNILSPLETEDIPYKIKASFPHDEHLFTQGFLIQDNQIYESTGLYNQSKIVRYPLGSNKINSTFKLNSEFFAEGLTYLDQHFYLLTWKEKVILKLNSNATEILETISMPTEIIEGWGITNDEHQFYISNGTSNIYVLNKNLEVIQKFQVVGHDKIYNQINELEFYDGYLYANIWHDSRILKINPTNGMVVGYIDLTELVNNHLSSSENVLNGIAFDPSGHMIITGKRWDSIYQLSLLD